MSSALYQKWKEQVLQAGANSSLSGNVKVALVNVSGAGTLYTFSQSHQFLSDITGAAIIGTSGNLASKTFTSGVFDAADITVTGVTGDTVEALVVYIDTGTGSTSQLVAYIDGLSFTPNGGDVTIQWDNGANKICAI